LLADLKADLAFIPSIWPETWCFTLSEAWAAGLYTLAFDLGRRPSALPRQNGRIAAAGTAGAAGERCTAALDAWLRNTLIATVIFATVVGHAVISSSEFAFTACFGVLVALVTLTDTTVPFAAVTVVVTAPSGAVVTVVVSLDDDDDDEAAAALDLLLEVGLVIEFSKLSAVEALPTAR